MSLPVSGGAGYQIAADIVGTPAAPTTGDYVQVNKLDAGAAGATSMVTTLNGLPVGACLVANPSATFTRPADTTQYASGDLVANNVTAGSVTALSWTATRVATGSCQIRRARLKKSNTTVTLATFRLHLYGASPLPPTNGDNAAWLTPQSTYLGSFDLDMTAATARVFSDAAEVIAAPSVGSEVNVALASGSTIYGLLEARAAYTPASAEVFTCELEVWKA